MPIKLTNVIPLLIGTLVGQAALATGQEPILPPSSDATPRPTPFEKK